MGLVQSFSHPGGNITGTDSLSEGAAGKRVGMLKEIVPQLTRLTLLYNPASYYAPAQLEQTQPALQTMGITSQIVEAATLGDFDGVFDAMRRDPAQAILVFNDPLVNFVRQHIIDFAFEQKIPMAGEDASWVRTGQLLSYGVALEWAWYRAASFVDKILKGADPAALPVERATKLDLAINLKTARALGLRIPDTMLAIATEVIE